MLSVGVIGCVRVRCVGVASVVPNVDTQSCRKSRAVPSAVMTTRGDVVHHLNVRAMHVRRYL